MHRKTNQQPSGKQGGDGQKPQTGRGSSSFDISFIMNSNANANYNQFNPNFFGLLGNQNALSIYNPPNTNQPPPPSIAPSVNSNPPESKIQTSDNPVPMQIDASTNDADSPISDSQSQSNKPSGKKSIAVSLGLTRSGDENKIGNIRISGRPKRQFGSSMGDHSTAYVVMEDAVRNCLYGNSLEVGAKQLDALASKLPELPGYAMIDRSSRKESIQAALDELDSVRDRTIGALSNQGNTANLLQCLQEYVGAYLEARDQIPLSVIRTQIDNDADRGKGKGEGSLLGESLSPEKMRDKILGLFDARAVGRVLAQPKKETMRSMAPGVLKEADDTEEPDIRAFALQHAVTMDQAYPGVIAKAFGSRETAVDSLVRKAKLEGIKHVKNLEKYNRKSGEKAKERIDYITNNIQGMESALAFYRIDNKGLTDSARSKWDYDTKKEYTDQLKEIDNGKKDLTKETKLQKEREESTVSLDERKKQIEAYGKPGDQNGTSSRSSDPLPGNGMIDIRLDKEIPGVGQTNGRGSSGQGVSAQIFYDAEYRITGITIAGRSPSPFQGMGAHVSAWELHTERINKSLNSKTFGDALDEIQKRLMPEAETSESKLKDKTGVEVSKKHEQMLDNARGELKRFRHPSDLWEQMQELQVKIGQLLDYVNLIPGTTLDSAKTMGSKVGPSMGKLRQFEGDEIKLTQAELRIAIYGLYDQEEVDKLVVNPEGKSALHHNHLEIVKNAFPKAYAAAFPAGHEAVGADPELIKEKPKSNKRKRSTVDDENKRKKI